MVWGREVASSAVRLRIVRLRARKGKGGLGSKEGKGAERKVEGAQRRGKGTLGRGKESRHRGVVGEHPSTVWGGFAAAGWVFLGVQGLVGSCQAC